MGNYNFPYAWLASSTTSKQKRDRFIDIDISYKDAVLRVYGILSYKLDTMVFIKGIPILERLSLSWNTTSYAFHLMYNASRPFLSCCFVIFHYQYFFSRFPALLIWHLGRHMNAPRSVDTKQISLIFNTGTTPLRNVNITSTRQSLRQPCAFLMAHMYIQPISHRVHNVWNELHTAHVFSYLSDPWHI